MNSSKMLDIDEARRTKINLVYHNLNVILVKKKANAIY